jgi:hypothetical protein
MTQSWAQKGKATLHASGGSESTEVCRRMSEPAQPLRDNLSSAFCTFWDKLVFLILNMAEPEDIPTIPEKTEPAEHHVGKAPSARSSCAKRQLLGVLTSTDVIIRRLNK